MALTKFQRQMAQERKFKIVIEWDDHTTEVRFEEHSNANYAMINTAESIVDDEMMYHSIRVYPA